MGGGVEVVVEVVVVEELLVEAVAFVGRGRLIGRGVLLA